MEIEEKLRQYHEALGAFVTDDIYRETGEFISFPHKESIVQLSMARLKQSIDETIEIMKIAKVNRIG